LDPIGSAQKDSLGFYGEMGAGSCRGCGLLDTNLFTQSFTLMPVSKKDGLFIAPGFELFGRKRHFPPFPFIDENGYLPIPLFLVKKKVI
jgi:hypothetical protein